jgi:hypothetical protein
MYDNIQDKKEIIVSFNLFDIFTHTPQPMNKIVTQFFFIF